MEGYKRMFDDMIVTVWSAPNYCYRYACWSAVGVWTLTTAFHTYRCGNVASVLQLDDNLNQDYKVFEAAPQDSRALPAKAAVSHLQRFPAIALTTRYSQCSTFYELKQRSFSCLAVYRQSPLHGNT